MTEMTEKSSAQKPGDQCQTLLLRTSRYVRSSSTGTLHGTISVCSNVPFTVEFQKFPSQIGKICGDASVEFLVPGTPRTYRLLSFS